MSDVRENAIKKTIGGANKSVMLKGVANGAYSNLEWIILSQQSAGFKQVSFMECMTPVTDSELH